MSERPLNSVSRPGPLSPHIVASMNLPPGFTGDPNHLAASSAAAAAAATTTTTTNESDQLDRVECSSLAEDSAAAGADRCLGDPRHTRHASCVGKKHHRLHESSSWGQEEEII
jgi:hypothetical protein